MKLTVDEKSLVLEFFKEFQENESCLLRSVDLQNIANDLDQGSEVELDVEDAPREIFYSPDTFLEWINSSVGENLALKDLLNSSDMEVVFNYSSNEEYGEEYHIIFASEKDGLFISLTGNMGQYNDENYDAHAYINFDFKSPKKTTQQKLLKAVSSTVKEFASTLQQKVNGAIKGLPPSLQDEAQHILTQEFLKIECLKPVLVEKERQELLSHVESSASQAKTKKRKV